MSHFDQPCEQDWADVRITAAYEQCVFRCAPGSGCKRVRGNSNMLTSAPFIKVKPQRVQDRAHGRHGFPRSLLRNLRAHPELLLYRLREFDSAIEGLVHGFSKSTLSWMRGHGRLRDGLHTVVVNEASSTETWPCVDSPCLYRKRRPR
jgi:hypothetical protein